MLLNVLLLLVLALLWVASLWYGVRLDFARWSIPGLISMHALPPLGVWFVWGRWREWRKGRMEAAIAERESKEAAERQAALEEARARHQQVLAYRQLACDCRLVTMTGLALPDRDALPEDSDQVQILVAPASETVESPSESVIEKLAPALNDALARLYVRCTAAVAFPIYLVPPSTVSAEESIGLVRKIREELISILALPVLSGDLPQIVFLSGGDTAPNSIISLFENNPDLPAAVVLAFDSPLLLGPSGETGDDADAAPEESAHNELVGKPSQGAFALLLTNSRLPEMLGSISQAAPKGEYDSMTPFWEKTLEVGGDLALLARLPKAVQEGLAALPVVARIHRAAFGQTKEKRSSVMDLTRTVRSLLEHAQVNAGMITPAFTSADDQSSEQTSGANPQGANEASAEDATSRCGWLVHNAGGIEQAGSRLVALSTALSYFGIELNPVEKATNVVTRVGNLGQAGPMGLLALSIAQVVEQKAPVLYAEFSGTDGVAVAFAMPAPTV